MNLTALLFSFQGRIRRGQFWFGSLLTFVIVVIPVLLGVALGEQSVLGVILMLAGQVFGTIASLAVGVKRCHDRGKSGWWILLTLIPLIGFIWWLIDLGMLEGAVGPNRFGPDPREPLAVYEQTFR